MSQFFRSALLLIFLLAALAPPALARLVIGVTPAVTPGVADPAVRSALGAALSSRLGDTVVIRSFDSEADELDWLIRFRELDAALTGRNLTQNLPAGTLLHLADLPPAVAVTHPGIAAGQHESLSRAFRSLAEDESGRQLLVRLAGTTRAAAASKPASTQRATPALAPALPRPGTAPGATPPLKTTAPAPPTPAPAAAIAAKPAASTTISTQSVQPVTALPPTKPTTVSPLAQTPTRQTPAASVATKPKAAAPSPAAQPAVAPANRKRTTLLLAAALVVMLGISAKTALLMRHWQQKKTRTSTPPEPPSAETFEYQGSFAHPSPVATSPASLHEARAFVPDPAPVTAERSPVPTDTAPSTVDRIEPAPDITASAPGKRPAARRRTTPAKIAEDLFPPADDTVVEQGRLGKVKVPALFKRCAELPQPVVLRVRTGDNETSVHFAGGQICHASSCNWRVGEGHLQWSKLGYLMVRDGLLSEAQRDQALELIERQPGLRFAAALQQLGFLDLEALRHILARQAKTTIYALILFSSGEYRIEADNGMIPAEESIALQVEGLIREASHHQSEWTAIRKVLPNLGTLLDFTPDGHEKLEQVRLSVHQQLLLSQIDGQTRIGTLCCDSTMMDYEACRFLYLMVKAGVLQVVPVT